MDAKRLPNGNLLVSVRVEAEGIIGDAVLEITPVDAAYAAWDEYLKQSPVPPADETKKEV